MRDEGATRPRKFARHEAVAAILVAGLMLPGAPAAAANPVELAVKATYLNKILPFVEWPDDAFETPTSPFTLCVVGEDPFGDLLDRAIKGQRFGDRPIEVRRIGAGASESRCQIIYMIADMPLPAAAVLRVVRGHPVLTVTDSADADPAKGIVNFVTMDNHVRLEINNTMAVEGHLKISSKLLNISVSVK